ncbi:MAG: hypothetical protein HY773_00720 [Candidatus Terrybacteria bacterium]|nr:hypothetical protein [Candidatus Terrybacteria bacterium]
MMRKNIIVIIIVIIAAIITANHTQAIGTDFSIDLIPSDPVPNTETRARISSLHFDANRAKITWELDGKALLSGMGERDFTFTSPELGKERRLTVYVITSEGGQAKKTLNLIGHDIDLLWEALTYTPVGYKGRAAPVIESFVRVAAIPHLFSKGKEIAGSDLIYEWYLNFKKDIPASGAGKNSFTFQLRDFDDFDVVLKVSSRDNGAVFEKGFTLSADSISTKPKILFYENNPLEGPRYNKALAREIVLSNGEIGIRAEPFFFSNPALERLSYEWTMNAQKIFPEKFANVLSLRAGGGAGRSVINLRISNPMNLLQTAEEKIEIQY